jgi:RNA 2',3'-cyclic 3'-phosphodiesterase
MRLFVAVELDESVRAAAQEIARQLQRRIGDTLRPKWVPPENMHLTVRFIGHVVDQRLPSVLAALEPSLSASPFDIALGACGVFPPHGPPRVLWIGLNEGLPSLRAMHEEFNRRLLPLGFEPETRPFSAHLTLARIKDAPGGSGAGVREALQHVRPTPARCRLTEAVLFDSRTSPKGSTYTALLRIPLRPQPEAGSR